MCGIAGFNLSPYERPVNSRKLAQYLLLGIEHRGPHATGAAWRAGEHSIVTQKRDMTASKWVESLSMPKRTQSAILHTRFWTQGHPKVNANNHPLTVGPITGVHNGTIQNDRELYADLGEFGVTRQAEVDSEVIFAMLAHGAAFEVQHDTQLFEKIEGAAAVAYMDTTGPINELHVARLCSSPLVIAQTEAGSFLFASTKEAILDAAKGVGLSIGYLDEKVKEGTYLRVRDGRIVEETKFEPNWEYYYWNQWKNNAKPALPKATPAYGDPWCDKCGDWEYYCTDPGGCKDPDWIASGRLTSPDKPSGHLANGIVETVHLFTTHDVPQMDDDTFYNAYKSRIDAIERFVEALEKTPKMSADRLLGVLKSNHWDVRPGDWVKTHISNPSTSELLTVYGQVLDVPDTFPAGDYLLRLMLGGEYVIARRRHFEFETLKPSPSSKEDVAEVVSIQTGELMDAPF